MSTSSKIEVARFLQATFCHFKQKDFVLPISPLHIVSIVGPSGSGKTTILSNLYAYLVHAYKAVFISAETVLPLDGTAGDYIEMVYLSGVGINTIDYAYLLAKKMDIFPLLFKDVNKLSLGEAHRLLLLQALCIDVPYIILDEPYANISSEDAVGVNRALAVALKQKKQAIIISQHEAPDHSLFEYVAYNLKEYVYFH